ncbi:MAG: YraN family protein [Pseudomonadales bacterium]|nr:YraN family protein [Pseudomonadales bacterium]
MSTKQTGTAAENLALKFLQTNGLVLVQRNFACKLGEIDLIMKDPKHLIFIEVRLRNNRKYGSGAETVNFRKQKKIIHTAQYYLVKYPIQNNLGCRFDVISIGNQIDWIKNAFTLDQE